MALDVVRAYLFRPHNASDLPITAEDRMPEYAGLVTKLNLSLYGTRDAANNWTQTYTALLGQLCFYAGKGCTCNFCHPSK